METSVPEEHVEYGVKSTAFYTGVNKYKIQYSCVNNKV